MKCELILIRHGIAVDHHSPGYAQDSDRPLTETGKTQMKAVGQTLDRLGFSRADLILSSPFVRARETAVIIHQALNSKPPLAFSKNLVPHASHKALLQELLNHERKPSQIILVGHEPFMSGLISLLTSGDENSLWIAIKKGAVAMLDCEGLGFKKCAVLKGLFSPDQLEAMQIS